MASFKTVAKIAVVCWSKQGEEILTNELVEVVSLKDLIIKGKGTPQRGTDVSCNTKMNYGKEKYHLFTVSLAMLIDSLYD